MAMTYDNTQGELTLDTGAISKANSSILLDLSPNVEEYEHDEVMSDADFIALLQSNRVTCDKQACVANEQAHLIAEMERVKPNAFARLKHGFVFHDDLPSTGSALHFHDACIPCDSMGTKEGCIAGKYCGFCHYCPVLHPSNGKHTAAESATKRRESVIEYENTMRQLNTHLQKLQDEPRSENATNIGSQHHSTGRCHPCIFATKGGCKDGDACTHCHVCDANMHRTKTLARKKVGKRLNKIIQSGNTTSPKRLGGEI